MSKYVLASEAAEKIALKCGVSTSKLDEVFADIPAADVVEVVRCKDCKHSFTDGIYLLCAYANGLYNYLRPDYYCSCGARKDGEEAE